MPGLQPFLLRQITIAGFRPPKPVSVTDLTAFGTRNANWRLSYKLYQSFRAGAFSGAGCGDWEKKVAVL
jgi:hypothetical protein